MFKIRKFSFFSFMAIIFVLISISLIIFTIKTEKRVKITGNNFLFDIQNSKYKEVFPDLVMLKGKIVSNINQDQKIEIYYDEIYQYFQLNYLEIRNPQINIFDQENKKIYYITSKIAYANNLEDINAITLKGEASISILLENIQIKGSLLVCDLINNQIKSDQDSLVIKDGFLISSKNLFINESLANFTNNVKIINQTGLYESKVVDEFINFNGSSQIATFYIRDKSIKLLNNAIVTSKMLDIKGDQINFYQIENKDDLSNDFDQRIYVLNGHAKYISKTNDTFYASGTSIDFFQGRGKLFKLLNGNGYYKEYSSNTTINFQGDSVQYSENLELNFIINNGFVHQRKYKLNGNKEIISQFYSKGNKIILNRSKNYSYKCINGYGYIQDLEKNNEVMFSGKTIHYIENEISKLNGDANIYDFTGRIYIKGEELIYYEDKEIVVSNSPFFLRQFNDHFNYENKSIFNGIKPDFNKDFLNIKKEKYGLLVNDVSALKGRMNTENSNSILEGNVNIIDYQNLIQIKSKYASYSGKEDQIYYAEGDLTVYQFQSIEKILDKRHLSSIIQSEKATVYKIDSIAYFEGEPKIKNFEDNFFIKSDFLEAHLDKKIYVFKDNIKLLVNTSENKEIENQIFIIGQYAVYENEKKIVTFYGPSILFQKSVELYVTEIFVDFTKKIITFKGIKDSRLQNLKF